MDHYKWSLRAGAGMILCAIFLRLVAAGYFHPIGDLLTKPYLASMMIYLETGRIVRFSDSQRDSTVFAPVVQPLMDVPLATAPPTAVTVPNFTAADAAGVTLMGTTISADPGTLIQ